MLRPMNMTTAGYLILYGGGLIVLGLLGYLSNPEKAKTALMTGGTFGALDSGVCSERGFGGWCRGGGDHGVVDLACRLAGERGWRAVLEGQSENFSPRCC